MELFDRLATKRCQEDTQHVWTYMLHSSSRIPMFEWYMAMFVVKNTHQNVTLWVCLNRIVLLFRTWVRWYKGRLAENTNFVMRKNPLHDTHFLIVTCILTRSRQQISDLKWRWRKATRVDWYVTDRCTEMISCRRNKDVNVTSNQWRNTPF